jgi:hypothetical protein
MLSQSSKVMGLGLTALLGSVLIVPACDSGGTNDNPSGGSSTGGGSSGAAQGGTGGTSAGATPGGSAGASAGSGGNTTQVVTACPAVVPPSPVIADFNLAPAAGGKYEWGGAAQGTMDFWGGTFNYPDALMLTFTDGAMTAAGHITEYAGFGLYVQNCADASSFDGIRFKIKGNPPMGKMSFAVQANKNEWATGLKGSCLAPDAQKFVNCVHPSAPITVTDTLTSVELSWSDFGMGKPAASATTDGSDVIGLQFILPWAEKAVAYDASVTIDDVEFIGLAAGGAGVGGAGNDPGMAGAGGVK